MPTFPAMLARSKANVSSGPWGLSGYYHIVEAERKITPGNGYMSELALERPRLYLEKLLHRLTG